MPIIANKPKKAFKIHEIAEMITFVDSENHLIAKTTIKIYTIRKVL